MGIVWTLLLLVCFWQGHKNALVIFWGRIVSFLVWGKIPLEWEDILQVVCKCRSRCLVMYSDKMLAVHRRFLVYIYFVRPVKLRIITLVVIKLERNNLHLSTDMDPNFQVLQCSILLVWDFHHCLVWLWWLPLLALTPLFLMLEGLDILLLIFHL